MLAVGSEPSSVWKWISVPVSILAVISLILSEMVDIRVFLIRMVK